MTIIQGVRINILPSTDLCQAVREAMYNRIKIEAKNLEEEKITLIIDKIEMNMNRAFNLGYQIGSLERHDDE